MADVKRTRRWMPIVLGLSLALNFAVVAAFTGAVWRHNADDRGGPREHKGGAIYMKALPREARRAIHNELRGGARKHLDAAEMVAALRSEPFNPAMAARVLESQRDDGLQRQTEVSEAWLLQVTAMSAQERGAYADRLEELSQQRSLHRKER